MRQRRSLRLARLGFAPGEKPFLPERLLKDGWWLSEGEAPVAPAAAGPSRQMTEPFGASAARGADILPFTTVKAR